MMKPDFIFNPDDPGARNLVLVIVGLCACLLCFYLFLAVRARMWDPHWAVKPTVVESSK